jgi:hypothetical protein
MPFMGGPKGRALLGGVAAAAIAWYNGPAYDALAGGYDAARNEGFLPPLGSEMVVNGGFNPLLGPDYAGNFVTNGSFNNGSTGWTAAGFTTAGGVFTVDPSVLVVNNGVATVTNSATLDFCCIQQQLTGLTIGVTYALTFDVINNGSGGVARINTLQTLNPGGVVDQATVLGTNNIYFTAGATSYWFGIVVQSTSDTAFLILDNISITVPTLVNGGFSTDATYGSNLIADGTMDAGHDPDAIGGWFIFQNGASTSVMSGGVLTITGDGTNQAGADQAITTVPGTTYELQFTSTGSTVGCQVGTAQGSPALNNSAPTAGTRYIRFGATSSTTWIRFSKTTAATVTVDNVTLRVFSAQPTGWTLKPGNAGTGYEYSKILSGALELFCDGTNTAFADQSFATVVGRFYEVQWTNGGGIGGMSIGTAQGGTQNLNQIVGAAGVVRSRFRALATTTWIRFVKGASGAAWTVDDVSVKEITNGAAIGWYNYGFETVASPFINATTGRANITTNNIRFEQILTTVVGSRYRVRFHSVWTGFLQCSVTTLANVNGVTLLSIGSPTTGLYVEGSFIAQTTTTYLNFNTNNTGGTIDDISVKEIVIELTGRTYGDPVSIVNADFSTNQTLGSEKILNGNFSSAATGNPATGWQLAAGGTATSVISGGVLTLTGDGSNAGVADQNFTSVVGGVYRITYTNGTSGNSLNIATSQFGSDIINGAQFAVGTVQHTFIATSTTTWLRFYRTAASAGTIDNVSIVEITNHSSVGWYLRASGTSTATISGGRLNLTGDNTNNATADQSVTTVVGQLYELNVTAANAFSGNVAIGTSLGGSQNYVAVSVIPVSGTCIVRFSATATTTWIRLYRNSSGGLQLDNVVLRPITNFGKYTKRPATFDEVFAMSTAASVHRSYTDSSGVVLDTGSLGQNFVPNSNTFTAWTFSNATGAAESGWVADTGYTEITDASGTQTGTVTTSGSTAFLPKLNQPYFFRLRVKKDAVSTPWRRIDCSMLGGTTQTVAINLQTDNGDFRKFGASTMTVTDGGTEWIVDTIMINNGTNTGWQMTFTPARTALAITDSGNQGAPTSMAAIRQAQVHYGTTALPFFNTGAVGAVTSNGQNQPRLTYKNGKRQLRVESEQRVQNIANAGLSGATVGSPGTSPTSWGTIIGTTNGLTGSVVGLGTLADGTAYIDFRVQGTATPAQTGLVMIPSPVTATAITASVGQVWSYSLDMALIAGSFANCTAFGLTLTARDAAGAGVEFDGLPVDLRSSLTSTMQRFSRTRTLGSGAARVTPDIRLGFNNNAVIDFTVRISKQQLEQGNYPSEWIPHYATSGTLTRAAEVFQFNGAATGIMSGSQGTVVYRGTLTNTATGFSRRLIGTATSGTLLYINSGSQNVAATYNGSVGVGATFGSGDALSPFGAAMSFDTTGSNRSVVANGGTVAGDANTTSSRSVVYLGRSATLVTGEAGDMYADFVGFCPEQIGNTQKQALAQAA